MGWSRRSNPADDQGAPDDPLADNLRIGRRRPPSGTQPLDNDPSIYDQQTVIDSNFSNRSQTRRQRQLSGGFSTQKLGSWAADPENSRKMMIGGGVVIGLLLLVALFYLYNGLSGGSAADDSTGTGSIAASEEPLGQPGDIVNGSAAPSADAGVGVVPQPVESVPGTDPGQQPAPAAGQAFVVTNTGVEGLFLRSGPGVDPPLATLPEGTRVEWTGESQNDGTREWRKVRTDQGEGWVAADFLQPAQ